MTGRNNFLSVRHNEGFWPEHLTTLEKIYLSRWDPFGADFAGKPDMPRKAPRKAAGERLEFCYLGRISELNAWRAFPEGRKIRLFIDL
jgi:hypothetical protein